MSARSDKVKKAAWTGFVLAILVALVVLYERFVLSRGPTLTWSRAGVDYELLSPKMLGLALLAPYFMWVVGKSLADLPMVQRVLSVLLRVAFVALLALGLSRLARTATTQKICTVYLVDVSESVPDAALDDARAEWPISVSSMATPRGKRTRSAESTRPLTEPVISARFASGRTTRESRLMSGA